MRLSIKTKIGGMEMQSKYQSFKEQVLNVGSGFIISALVWEYFIKHLIREGYITLDSTLIVTCIFTVVSLIRGYVWRRVFNSIDD